MWRIFRHYSIATSYDGVCCNTGNPELADLDPCHVAGSIRIKALLEIIRQRELKFAVQLKCLSDLETFKSLLKCEPDLLVFVTAKKWKGHLRAMEGFGLIKRKAKNRTLKVSRDILQ